MSTHLPGFQSFFKVFARAALTTHELEWLEPWGKLAELELKSWARLCWEHKLYKLQCIHSSGVECYSDLCTSSARFKIKQTRVARALGQTRRARAEMFKLWACLCCDQKRNTEHLTHIINIHNCLSLSCLLYNLQCIHLTLSVILTFVRRQHV